MKLTLSFEVGGQDIEWHVEYTPATPDTWHEPGDSAELSVERAMLLTHVDGWRPQTAHRLDILDLITEVGEVGEDGLPDFIYTALCDLAEQALVDAREADEEARAESIEANRRLDAEEGRDD